MCFNEVFDLSKRDVKGLNAHYAAIHSTFWAGYAIIWGFLSVVLLRYGFSNSQIGVISSISLLLPIAVQPPLAALTDRSAHITSRHMLMFLTTAGLLTCLVLWLFAGDQLLVVAGLFIVIGTVITVIPPFLNAMAMEFVLSGTALNYGMGRGVGSFFYGVSVLFAGLLVQRHDPRLVMPLFLVCFTVMLLTVYLFRRRPLPAAKTANSAQVMSIAQLLKAYPRYTATLVGCALLMAGHTPVCTYMNHVVGKAGGKEAAMGAALAIAAMMELPAMSLFETFKKRFSIFTLFRFCAVMFVVRNLLFLAASSVLVVYVSAVLNFFEYGIFLPATVYFVAQEIDTENQVKGQALIHTASSGIGSAVGVLCAGRLLDLCGTNGMLIFTTGCTVLGFGVICLSTRRRIGVYA